MGLALGACTTLGTGSGSTSSGDRPVSFAWTSKDGGVTGTMSATLSDGGAFTVLPGSGKSFDQFRADDLECQQFAQSQVGGATPGQAASDSAVKSAVVGTAVGAAAGAALNGSRGAAAGAGAGLLIGALAGTGAGEASGYSLQRRYDAGYVQCMYAKGNQVPSAGRSAYARRAASYPPPPPPGYPPPPPPY
jgi:hypothetical protein